MKYTIWTKDRCGFCNMAKRLLKSKGFEYEERNVTSGDWTKDQMLEAAPGAKTFPQIFEDGKYIGGFTELNEYLNK